MNRFIRENQKKLLAFFGVLLMIVFIIPTSVKYGRNNVTVRTVGTYNGVKLQSDELSEAKNELGLLTRLHLGQSPLPLLAWMRLSSIPPGTPTYLAVQMLSQDPVWREIAGDATKYLLLQKEAQQMGIQVNEDELNGLMKNLAPNLSDENQQQVLRNALANMLLIRSELDRVGSVVKVSQPKAEHLLDDVGQKLTLSVVEFPASKFLDKAPVPTTQEVQKQYDAFHDRQPGHGDLKNDPMGFGYTMPNRISYQDISVSRERVRRAIEDSKPANIDIADPKLAWETLAYREFAAHPDRYPSTQPTTRPLALGPGLAPATQPTTAPSPQALFEQYKGSIIKDLVDQEVTTRLPDIEKKIQSTMNTDWVAYHEAKTSGKEPPVASVGVPYDHREYMPRLAEMIQKQTGVLPTVMNIPQLRTADEIATSGEDIAHATTSGRMPFAVYATTYAEPLLPPEQANNSDKLAVLQPSQILEDSSGTGYIFRISAAEAAHVQPLEQVKDRVASDWRLKQAYDLALKSAQKWLETARSKGLLAAAAEAQAAGEAGSGVIALSPFTIGQIRQMQTVPGYPGTLKKESVAMFMSATQKLLQDPVEAKKPTGIIELPPDAMVDLAEVTAAQPTWTPDTLASEQADIAHQLAYETRTGLLSDWAANVDARLNFQPDPTYKGSQD